MRDTKRPIAQARAIPVRGRRTIRLPRLRRTPVTALVLSLLGLLAPELLLAPTLAVDPPTHGQPAALRWLDEASPREAPVVPTSGDRRTAGGLGQLGPALAAPVETPRPVDAGAYEHAADAARAEARAHGISVAVVRDGELEWAGASGRARDGRTPLTADSSMVIGSVTKTFVAAAVLALVEEGRLVLDDPVRDHLPELGWLSGEITVRQLMSHTSGLADLFNDATRRGLEDEPGRGWTSDEIFAALHEPWYQPGEGWAYANTNYYLLGMLVERLEGATLDETLAARFLVPQGLDGTRLLSGAEGDPLTPAWTTIFWASGAMVAPAGDIARWGDALYRDGVLSAETREAMLRFNDEDYGLGVQRIEVGRTKGIGHTGLLNTYTTLLFHVPDADVTIALLVNRSHVDLAAMLRARPKDGPSLLDLALDRARR